MKPLRSLRVKVTHSREHLELKLLRRVEIFVVLKGGALTEPGDCAEKDRAHAPRRKEIAEIQTLALRGSRASFRESPSITYCCLM
jgi:hypothetical protein